MDRKKRLKLKRHRRIRLKMRATAERPRLVVHRSLKNLSAQVIDDTKNKVLFYFSTTNKELKQKLPSAGNIKAAQVFGEIFAQKVREKKIAKVIFDREGYLYHGRIKAFAEALRNGGLEF